MIQIDNKSTPVLNETNDLPIFAFIVLTIIALVIFVLSRILFVKEENTFTVNTGLLETWLEREKESNACCYSVLRYNR